MKTVEEEIETLKNILKKIQSPAELDSHPWAEKRFVRQVVEKDPLLATHSPGYQLLVAIATLFRELVPPTPPVRGKRLDTRWGRFGILAANYFAPFLFGRLYPNSLRDAWRHIDNAIFAFVYGDDFEKLSDEEYDAYCLIRDEADMPANSTISDWHRQGLKELAELILNRESYLRENSLEAASIPSMLENTPPKKRMLPWKGLLAILGVLLLVGVVWGGMKAHRVYTLTQSLRADLSALEAVDVNTLELDTLPDTLAELGTLLEVSQQDLAALEAEAEPWFWLASRLDWVPVYGSDIRQSEAILDYATNLLDAVQGSYDVGVAFVGLLDASDEEIGAYEITSLLLEKVDDLHAAQKSLDAATDIRANIAVDELSLKTAGLFQKIIPYESLLNQALSLSLTLPDLLGATQSGPKTYLLLIQNEDELRPTGGFLTSVAKVVLRNGELISFDVQDSYNIDVDDELYPPAPWQLDQFMNIPVVRFRDSNWFSNYPTTALWAEYLYAKKYTHSVDGVIAINQHVLVSLLEVTGPIYVPEIEETISSENVLQVMREQKLPSEDVENRRIWIQNNRKDFMRPISSALLELFVEGDKNFSWVDILKKVVRELDQRQILVQLDDSLLTNFLAERGWDGAIRYRGGDFLFVAEANVGYNKTNAKVSRSFTYDVDLTDLTAPQSNLVLFHHNAVQNPTGEPCIQRVRDEDTLRLYPISRCYYSYTRIYKPAGTVLTDAAPHPVSRLEMEMLYEDVPARVDLLDEKIENIQTFGTLLMVPKEETLETGFSFALPSSVLQSVGRDKQQVYRLFIQKQSGLDPVPVTLRVHLPQGAKVLSASHAGITNGNDLLFELTLDKDIAFEIIFSP